MDTLRVRAYNVHFGDAILISVPDRDAAGTVTTRHILIDVGNVLVGSGGVDEVFGPVIDDILNELGGKPLDLYVMTHEHLDHVQGLLWAKEKRGLELSATHSWLTGSADPNYYDNNPEAKKKKLALEDTYAQIATHFALSADEPTPAAQALLMNNNPRRTADCVAHLRAVGDTTTYISRSTDLTGTHPFNEASFEIWGPEEDTSMYYGRFRPMGLGLASAANAGQSTGDDGEVEPPLPIPPAGVDAGAFYDFVDRRQRGIFDNLLKIDKASNNTSVVMLIEWRGWRLLFPGDAESRSWKEMNKRDLLRPVHMLKLGHHGSHNGTPTGELLEKILPVVPHDDRSRSALLSTHEGTYNKVPDVHTLNEITARCDTIARIGEADDDLFIDLNFPDLTIT